MEKEKRDQHRRFLSDRIRMEVDWRSTDQNRGLPSPPIEKPVPDGTTRIPLPGPQDWGGIGDIPLKEAIANRQSRRVFTSEPLSMQELGFLLWAIQGVRRRAGPFAVFRTVPSAGNRHSFETYMAVMNVEGIEPGLYRYLPLEHELVLIRKDDNLGLAVANAALGQSFCGSAAVTFIWTTVPYRMEWRYHLAAHRVIPIDLGHVGQNLYLACEGIGAGTCTIAAYDQGAMDKLLEVDGDEEFALYLAPVGKVVKD